MATVDGDILLQNLEMDNDLFIMEPDLTLPNLTIDVQVVFAEGDLTFPNLSIEVGTDRANGVDGECLLPTLSIEVETGMGVGGSAELRLPHISIEVSANIQTLAEGDITFPNLSIELEGGQACTVDAELALPDILLSVDAITAIAESFETWIINAVTMAHGQYDNYSFNSYIELNGVYYGLNSAGIWSLTGATDNGTAIAASAKWGVVNLGTDQEKIVDGGFLHCRMGDALVVGLSTEEGTRYPYTATDHGKTGIHAERWKSGKGLKGIMFQPDIANVAGADFDITQLDMLVNKCQRRAG